ncbi:EAL domain-containing protein [Corallincola spongiicola]|uniref:EAL domain-containing protein n=2 Tax=Corallincola spongiicola TaxID=2520508 RepID=A0ABY1WUX8_9GAMM|nr:EAL domain-containing protein [Corallincola spongiicola]
MQKSAGAAVMPNTAVNYSLSPSAYQADPWHQLHPEHFFPWYQPFIHVASGEIAGYEALARTKNRDGQMISAGPLFSDPTVSFPNKLTIDRYLRQQALTLFAQQSDAGFITLNISPEWLQHLSSQHTSMTVAMVEKLGIDPSRVIIEITEQGGDIEALKRLVKSYHQAGMKIAIDDFGAGASQVDRIIELQPDIIKLDMQLFKQAAKGGAHADVALSVTTLAQRAGSRIVCEGVESEDEFHFGLECGAHYMQGWLFQPAAPGLLAKQSCHEQMSTLRKTYLSRKTIRLSDTMMHNIEVKDAVYRLRSSVMANRPTTIDAERLRALGVARYYLCDSGGTQRSANFEVTESGIETCNECIGYNWSHRPYFPTLIALQRIKQQRMVVSPIYRDTNSLKLCKTFGIFITPNEILLVDVHVDDHTLFAENARYKAGF